MDGFIGLVLPRTRHAIATAFDVFLYGTALKQLSATSSRRFEVVGFFGQPPLYCRSRPAQLLDNRYRSYDAITMIVAAEQSLLSELFDANVQAYIDTMDGL